MRRMGYLLLLGLGACATAPPPMSWQRMNGQPVDSAAFQPVFLQCKGEAFAAAANAPAAALPNVYLLAAAEGNRNQTRDAVMGGCMSKSGYVWTTATATPMRWTKPGATQEIFMQDRYVCLQEAQQGRSTMDRPLFVSCMAARGYIEDPNGSLYPPLEAVVRAQ